MSHVLDANGAIKVVTNGRLVDYLTVTGDTTLDNGYEVILADATGGNLTITLPSVSTYPGQVYTIKKIDGTINTVTVDGAGSQTIDGELIITIIDQYVSITIANNGVAWYIL